eukprot:TRINITY_DN12615_c0_g1_i1.p1 TRINITY_DN12615_c0_g1~~TRINITY_DN12615_c0_g1_i1.p1  ORF type:complete len:238 (-),score=24.56 TRINITY_DN12615_c0_g1_i1:32-718(-)
MDDATDPHARLVRTMSSRGGGLNRALSKLRMVPEQKTMVLEGHHAFSIKQKLETTIMKGKKTKTKKEKVDRILIVSVEGIKIASLEQDLKHDGQFFHWSGVKDIVCAIRKKEWGFTGYNAGQSHRIRCKTKEGVAITEACSKFMTETKKPHNPTNEVRDTPRQSPLPLRTSKDQHSIDKSSSIPGDVSEDPMDDDRDPGMSPGKRPKSIRHSRDSCSDMDENLNGIDE